MTKAKNNPTIKSGRGLKAIELYWKIQRYQVSLNKLQSELEHLVGTISENEMTEYINKTNAQNYDTVLSVYNIVAKRARELRESKDDNDKKTGQELYWVMSMLENTKEVNPPVENVK